MRYWGEVFTEVCARQLLSLLPGILLAATPWPPTDTDFLLVPFIFLLPFIRKLALGQWFSMGYFLPSQGILVNVCRHFWLSDSMGVCVSAMASSGRGPRFFSTFCSVHDSPQRQLSLWPMMSVVLMVGKIFSRQKKQRIIILSLCGNSVSCQEYFYVCYMLSSSWSRH